MTSRTFRLAAAVVSIAAFFSLTSCSKKEEPKEIDGTKVQHAWYYFTQTYFRQTTLPQDAPEVVPQPWTEAIRISSAAAVPVQNSGSTWNSYALVNRLGVLGAKGKSFRLYRDNSIFANQTASSMVFSKNVPVFYLYKSSFFNEELQKLLLEISESPVSQIKSSFNAARPFLVEFNPDSKLCFPLVTYENLKLNRNDEITGYFWNGKTWVCSAKTSGSDNVSFKYFSWEPLVPLTDLSPALTENQLNFKDVSEGTYRQLNTPKLFHDAPAELRELLSHIPSNFPFYVSWRDQSGTSPVSYYHPGNNAAPVNAFGSQNIQNGCNAVLFSDGTTYLYSTSRDSTIAFRLPKLPSGFIYTDFFITSDGTSDAIMYAGWEETSFYRTARSGFLTVNIDHIFDAFNSTEQ